VPPLSQVNGCYFNVMGLPMHTLALQIKGLIETKKL
jgi:predicted house-cleaning NTP pyrophosphatase (Maf/HAM1 superfamily)